MTYQIKRQINGGYFVVNVFTNKILKENLCLDEANQFCWQDKEWSKRYQILSNCFNGKQELCWYYEETNGIVIPNGYASLEEARLDIVADLKEVCLNNDYVVHPNPNGDYSIIDTFTGQEMDYSISHEESMHPDPEFSEIE